MKFVTLTSLCLSFERGTGQHEEDGSSIPSESSLLVLLLPIALSNFKRGPYTVDNDIIKDKPFMGLLY